MGERKVGCGGKWAAYGVMSEKKTALQHAAENARHGNTSQDKTGKEKREGGGQPPRQNNQDTNKIRRRHEKQT